MDLLRPRASGNGLRGRVLVLVPRWTSRGDPGPQGVPFRTFTLASAFLHAGHEVVFFDQEHDLDRTDRFPDLERLATDATAAFVWMNECYPFNQCVNALGLASRLRASRGDLPIVVGGEFVTLCPPTFFDGDFAVDYFLRGYGEKSGLALLGRLLAHGTVEDVPGLVWRGNDGSLRHNPQDRKPDFEPDYLEMYRRIDLRPYVQRGGLFGNDQPTLTIGTGRGCVKGCGFCAWRNHPARILAAEHVVGLMEDLRERYGVRQFHIGELDFFTSRRRALGVADGMRERAPDCAWFALGSPCDLVRLSDDEWDRLAAGGVRKIEIGSESGSARLLRAIGKTHTPEDVFVVSKKMIERGIVPMNNFLFGFPGETREDRDDSLRLIHRIWNLSPERNCMTFRYYQACWDTPLGDRALACVEGAPRTVTEFLATRHEFDDESRRTIPWIPERDEREVKHLVNHYLPLMTSKLVIRPPWRRGIYRTLRSTAERRVASRSLSLRWDRRLYDRFIGRPLDRTYVP